MTSLYLIYSIFSFLMGAVIASFLNVVIWRVPRGESIVSPPSHCPKCNARIKWYQNIPILSYLALRGRCANCRDKISPRYLIVETIGGLLFFAAFRSFGLCAPVMWLWFSLLIVGTMIDFDHKLLPDFVTVGGMLLGVAASFLYYTPIWHYGSLPVVTPLWSVIGLAFGFGLMYLVRFFGSKAFKREAMGLGDVFLMGAVGAISGPIGVLMVLIFSSFLGSVIGVAALAISHTRLTRGIEIPYGPYIAGAHLIVIFYGPEILHWYLH